MSKQFRIRTGRCFGLFLFSLVVVPAILAQSGTRRNEVQTPIPGLPEPPPSPALPPEEAAKTFHTADGFRIELAASEPAVQDPVSIAFDADGRLFVVEMRGFMVDLERTGEREPTGRISLLEDTDHDGRYEKATVFLDRLVLPRAVATVNGGILFVSDSKLWFAPGPDSQGKAGPVELIDPDYAAFGNVEHAPNGLMRALDNWIYNAKSTYRYRWIGGIWIKQPTEFRGQWGITQDDYGRLFYNVNDSQLLGDVTPPNYMGRNPHYRTSAGLNLTVSTNQQVFTVRMNTAVNRGYRTNVLDPAGKLREFSSSCAPVIYRGDNFPPEVVGDAFVCDPSANLVKRNIVFDHGLALTSRFAYERSEFLTSTDERFRPVNAFNGPDGALWIVDMYRGVIQYGLFMTPYLRRESLERGLDKPIHLGRIYRVVSTERAPAKVPKLSGESSATLVERLSHPNGWIRDTAQRLLVERADRSTASLLLRLALNGPNPLGRIHALWSLEGLFAALPGSFRGSEPSGGTEASGPDPAFRDVTGVSLLPSESLLEAPELPEPMFEELIPALEDPDIKVQAAAIRVLEILSGGNRLRQERLGSEFTLKAKRAETAPEVLFQIALSAGNLLKPAALPALLEVASRDPENLLLRDAVLSGLKNWELQFLKRLLADPRWEGDRSGAEILLQGLAGAVMKERDPEKIVDLLATAAEQKPEHGWRRRALMEGIAAQARNPRFASIRLDAAPPAFETLSRVEDPELREWINQAKGLFSWPGHEGTTRDAGEDRIANRRTGLRREVAWSTGKIQYQQVCGGCHGINGEGLPSLGPPLVRSDWVVGPAGRLIRMVLHGVTGPIHVNGTRYEPPQILSEMPSVAALEDFEITAILNYIRGDWGHEAAEISSGDVSRIRRETAERERPWTEEELLAIQE